MNGWNPPVGWRRITTIDAHTAGEPLRVITAGVEEPPGRTMAEKRSSARVSMDGVRRVLMWEPRGHADMYGCLPTEPVTPDGDIGVLFMHNEGFSTMCGHGIIGLVVVGHATGLLTNIGEVRIDTPAGRVTASAEVVGDSVSTVRFRNVPSFVAAAEHAVDVPGIGRVVCDVAYGGAFYAYVPAARFGFGLTVDEADDLIDVGRRIKHAVADSISLAHPGGDETLGFLYGTIFVGEAHDPTAHSRNVCVFADGEVDRSPTGTGVSGRLAIHRSRGELGPGTEIVVESILGTTFTGRVIDDIAVGSYAGVVPEIGGRAWITGKHEFVVDPSDPLADGFLVR